MPCYMNSKKMKRCSGHNAKILRNDHVIVRISPELETNSIDDRGCLS